MSNNTINRVNATLDPKTTQKVKDAISSIRQALPFLIGLTAQERVSLPKISVSNKIFTEDAIMAAVNNPELFPPFIKPQDMKKDLELYQALDELVLLIQQLAEQISDTQTLAGSEAYTNGLIIYKMISAAANSGIPGTKTLHNQLRQRFTSSIASGSTAESGIAAPAQSQAAPPQG